MGFYIRKSVSVGPLRFNLSKSGIGVSAGIRGFRVGSGPRGNYVHMGSGGFYYRQTLPSDSSARRESLPRNLAEVSEPATHGPMETVSSGPVAKMVDSSSQRLLSELEEKQKRIVWWPFAAAAAAMCVIGLAVNRNSYWTIAPVAVLSTIGVAAVYVHDAIKKSVVIMYDLDDSMRRAFESLHESTTKLARCGATWHVDAKAHVYDPKYHAGAGQLVNRNRISVCEHDPPYVKTNVTTVRIPIGKRQLYFFPDRMLIYGSEGVGAISYDELAIEIGAKRFIEEESVPFDATIVDRTWRYVNKKGGPDRRFNNNRELPICLYEELYLTSSSGLNEILQVSCQGLGDVFRTCISAMVESIDVAREAELQREHIAERTHKQTLETVAGECEAGSTPATTTAHSPEMPTNESICDALLRILCCVMVSDGRASQSERKLIGEIMQNVKSPWSAIEVNARIDTFINGVMSNGYQRSLADALPGVHLFVSIGREATLVRCIDAVAAADKNSSERELALCKQIKLLLSK
jgi:hypothetical protein